MRESARWAARGLMLTHTPSQGFHHPNMRKSGACWGPRFRPGLNCVAPDWAWGTCTRSQGYRHRRVYKMGLALGKDQEPTRTFPGRAQARSKPRPFAAQGKQCGAPEKPMPVGRPSRDSFVPQDKSGQAGATKSEKQIPNMRKSGTCWGPRFRPGLNSVAPTGLKPNQAGALLTVRSS